MENFFSRLMFLILCFNASVNGFTQNLSIKTRSENIGIKKDSSFVNNVSVLLKSNEESIVYPIFYDGELEEITDIQVFSKKGKKYKLQKKSVIREEDVEYDFITSKKVKYIFIPPNTEAKITYTLSCNELMYFSDLRFFSYNEIDSLKYKITVPNIFKFIHSTIYKESLDFISIDSSKFDKKTTWNIEVIPVKVEPDPFLFFGIYKNIKEPLMRTLIIPSNYEGNERKYMNDWYLEQLETTRGLSKEVMVKIDELTNGISNSLEILDILYNYIKNNFKYVAIEVGMGAFIPSNINEVFVNKQGDCKDLSNFLSEALNYKGIESHVALAATFDHISDCDFPSLTSANHVICVAYIDGEFILLDPTDPIHSPQTPIQSIQDRTFFIINPNGGQFVKAESFSAQQNLITYKIDLEVKSNKTIMEGTFAANYNGVSGNFIRRNFLYKSVDKIKTDGKTYYESVLGNQSISDFKLTRNTKFIKSEGTLSVNDKIFKDGESRFLFVDFLPNIIESQNRESLLEGTHIDGPFNKEVRLVLKMDEPFQPFSPIEHTFSENGIDLIIKISHISDNIIKYNYDFIFNYSIIDEDNLDLVNEALKSFKNVINEPIILYKKS